MMKILIVGAGAVGGYFGGRLTEFERDVTFLVRQKQAIRIRENGLSIMSPHGGATVHPKVVEAHEIKNPYDLVLLCIKAYSLETAVVDVAAAVGRGTIILPLLNGMRHFDVLDSIFGEEIVIGGFCLVATDTDSEGQVIQLAKMQKVVYGERHGGLSERIEAVHATMRGAGFDARISENIQQELWEKWVQIASLSALTCLLRGNVGEIARATGGKEIALVVLGECSAVASACGFALGEIRLAEIYGVLTASDSNQTSSMYRDLLKGRPVESYQIVGDLLKRGLEKGVATPLLQAAAVSLALGSARGEFAKHTLPASYSALPQ
jgi:2-dehydropantoate 2-reductase